MCPQLDALFLPTVCLLQGWHQSDNQNRIQNSWVRYVGKTFLLLLSFDLQSSKMHFGIPARQTLPIRKNHISKMQGHLSEAHSMSLAPHLPGERSPGFNTGASPCSTYSPFGPRLDPNPIARSRCSVHGLDPNSCQKECQIECQNRCQIECQNECQNICQNQCQNRYRQAAKENNVRTDARSMLELQPEGMSDRMSNRLSEDISFHYIYIYIYIYIYRCYVRIYVRIVCQGGDRSN